MVRSIDILARNGGEEFVVLLPEADVDTAYRVAERLRNGIELLEVETDYGKLGVTISVGVAQLSVDMNNLTDFIEAADKAEHDAKQMGRNRVEIFAAKKENELDTDQAR
jgi:diguanylate cyclase (GGDEF)-like protein